MEGIDTAKSVIKIMTLVLQNLESDTQKLMSAMTPEIYATDKALKLVNDGIPFRDAYKQVAEELKKK
ncbi:argininosuccinate lyase, partial [Candidatus Woesearchaeota archaeon]|nr:argininosuccinate lyase [Candidatus Woesearchaeota archaeon]